MPGRLMTEATSSGIGDWPSTNYAEPCISIPKTLRLAAIWLYFSNDSMISLLLRE